MKAYLAALIVAAMVPSFGSRAMAQDNEELTAQDGQAFYCSAVVPYLTSLVRSIPRPTKADIAAHPELAPIGIQLDSALTRMDGDQRRLAVYLAFRLLRVDVLQASLAMKSGQDDVEWLKEQAAKEPCATLSKDQQAKCANDSLEQSGVGQRLARCRDLSWLP
jgi:hypothetical protein